MVIVKLAYLLRLAYLHRSTMASSATSWAGVTRMYEKVHA
jgi:hypothetical protein